MPKITPSTEDNLDDHNFNFNGRSLHLTYKTHLKKKSLEDLIKKENIKCAYDAVHETADERHPYEHTHVLMSFNKPVHFTNCRKFDIEGIHPNIKAIRTREHWKNSYEYIRKERNPFVRKLTGNEWMWLGNVRDIIQSHRSFDDVLNDDTIVHYVRKYLTWAHAVFSARPQKKFFRHKELRLWQRVAKKKLLDQDDRKVLWIYDPKGNGGKTQLGKHLKDEGSFYTRGGKATDIAYKYKNQDNVILDLTRSQEEYTPYKLIEQFKDGIIESTKYRPIDKYPHGRDTCRVCIFANYLPETQQSISADRWEIYKLENNKLVRIKVNEDSDFVTKPFNINSWDSSTEKMLGGILEKFEQNSFPT